MRALIFILLFFALTTGSFVLMNQMLLLSGVDLLFFIKKMDIHPNYVLALLFSWGIIGAVINNLTSKFQLKKFYKLEKINEGTVLFNQIILINKKIAKKLKIKPASLYFYKSEEKNAFCAGLFKNSALIGVSSNLIYSLDENEMEAVLLHEYAHIVNGDMFIQQSIEGVLNAYVLFSSKIIQLSLIRGYSFSGIIAVIFMGTIFEWFFLFLAKLFYLWFSRNRELIADKFAVQNQGGGVHLLSALNNISSQEESLYSNINLGKKFFNIYEYKSEILSTHPSFKNRYINIESSL